jgi:tetratricopeptide (TPR) repeat protein
MGKWAGAKRRRPGDCPRHAGEPAIMACEICKSAGCPECIEHKWGKDICPTCLHRRKSIRAKAAVFSILLFSLLMALGWVGYGKLSKKIKKNSQIIKLAGEIKKNPLNDAVRWRLINLYTVKKQPKKAIYHLLLLLKRHPSRVKFLERIVSLYKGVKDYQNALLWVERAKQLDGNNYNLLKLEGEIWKGYGNLDECEKAWLSAYHLKPTDLNLAFSLVDLFIEQTRYKDASRILSLTMRSVRTVTHQKMVQVRIDKLRVLIDKAAL